MKINTQWAVQTMATNLQDVMNIKRQIPQMTFKHFQIPIVTIVK